MQESFNADFLIEGREKTGFSTGLTMKSSSPSQQHAGEQSAKGKPP
jgi:hypothetical protein